MKISTKGRYALRLMMDIAIYGESRPVRIRDIAERQGISDKYLEQIISNLNKAEYVKSIRGPQGGYRLTMEPHKYTVGMILRLTEGSLAPVACMEEDGVPCEKQLGCATLELWKRIDDAVKSVVDTVTLADLLAWQEQKEGE
ncbi:MAG: Rrf2 family transcriptional regulator [Lachnospiraceae bacterium]|nr:Rrf2 family transcriptional regulator [Lachnospiraceae bacterium]